MFGLHSFSSRGMPLQGLLSHQNKNPRDKFAPFQKQNETDTNTDQLKHFIHCPIKCAQLDLEHFEVCPSPQAVPEQLKCGSMNLGVCA